MVKKRKIDSNKLESEDSSWEDSDAGHVSKKSNLLAFSSDYSITSFTSVYL